LREPILTLCLLGGIIYLIPDSNNNRKNRSLLIAGIFIGYGILTKLAFVVNLIPIVVYLFLSSLQQKQNFQTRLKEALIFMIPIILIGFVGTGLYNYLRFGNSFNSGYAGGTSFTTPFYVGLFGLLLSPGKGLIWFAPILMLLIPAQKFFRARFPHEMYLIAGLFILNLLLSSMYVAWGGDGSWGPRYLAPFLPLLLLPIGFYLEHGSTVLKRMAILLTLIGVIIQIGGISIYAGAYLREIGEYPYERGFEEPEFLYKAHFIPNYSPAIGHWRMLTRNASEHLDGKYPTLEISNQLGDKRLPIAQEDQSKLLHTLDYWFTYALYANVPKNIILTLLVVLVGLCGMTGFLLRRALLSNTIQ
ncbi:MAG: hypothetical protein HY800_10060, partial [Ignavibacteriales bacterium]|nr:hypothetical protein [Ignavibacteriales bacterium]